MITVDGLGTEYKSVPGTPDLMISKSGHVLQQGRADVSLTPIDGGYFIVQHKIPGVTKARHRLMAMAWKELPDNYLELDVNHLDGVPGNDHPDNLEWCTRAGNIRHAVDMGLIDSIKLYAKDLSTGLTYSFPSMARFGEFANINRATASAALINKSIAIVKSKWLLSKDATTIFSSELQVDIDARRYGIPTLISTKDNSRVEYKSIGELVSRGPLNLSEGAIRHRLETRGSEIDENYKLVYNLYGTTVSLKPVKEVAIKSIPVYVQKIDGGSSIKFDSIAKARDSIRVDRQALLDALLVPGTVLRNSVRVGYDPTFTKTREDVLGTNKVSGTINSKRGSNKSMPAYAYNVLTGVITTHISPMQLSKDLGMSDQPVYSALSANHLKAKVPKYRVSYDKSAKFPTSLTTKEVKDLGTLVVSKNGNIVMEAPSIRAATQGLLELGLGGEARHNSAGKGEGIRKHFGEVLKRARAMEYDIYYRIEDIRFNFTSDGKELIRVY